MIGKLTLDGTDINLQMIRSCNAWHYKSYESEQSASDRTAYSQAQFSAQTNRCGIFADPLAQNPAEFRRERFISFYVGPRVPNVVRRLSRSILMNSLEVTGGSTDWSSSGGSSGSTSGGGSVSVRPYYRRDGTYVRGHTRSRPRN